MAASYVGRLGAGGVAPGIDTVTRLASALGTTVHHLLPPDAEAVRRGRAEELFAALVRGADRELYLISNPPLARLAESPAARR